MHMSCSSDTSFNRASAWMLLEERKGLASLMDLSTHLHACLGTPSCALLMTLCTLLFCV